MTRPPYLDMPRRIPRPAAWSLFLLAACTDGPPVLIVPAPPPSASVPTEPLGFGGSAGADSAGAAGLGAAGLDAGTAGSSGTAGVGGLPSAGAAGAPPPCSLTGPASLSACEQTKKTPCTSCLCSSPACASAWALCQADDRCEQAAQCLVLGCPSSYCAALVGAAQTTLIPVLDCFALGCAGACSGTAGQGGSGSGGEAGDGGSGTSGQAGLGGTAPAGGEAGEAGASGEAGSAPAGSGGEAGDAGNAGASDGGASAMAGAAPAGNGGEAGDGGKAPGGAGGIGDAWTFDCDAPAQAPSLGACLTSTPQALCNPLQQIPCPAGELCSFTQDDPPTLACVPGESSTPLCAPCDATTPCPSGLVCLNGACARLCCLPEDCGPAALCHPLDLGLGACVLP
jgi:hypothetical protein